MVGAVNPLAMPRLAQAYVFGFERNQPGLIRIHYCAAQHSALGCRGLFWHTHVANS